MASTDSRPVPIKNTAYRAVFPILDKTGALVTAAAGLDSEVSKDQGTFADCTNEATEIATSSGVYYLDLTATEMNADCVAVIVKTTTTDAKTTVLVFYPQESGDIKVDLQSIATATVSTSTAQLGVNVVNAAGTAWGSGAITAGTFAADAITAAKLAADVTTELQSGLATAAALTTVSGKIDVVDDFLDTEVAAILAAVDTEVAAIKAKTDNLPTDPADASDIASSFTTVNTKLDTIDDFLDTEVAAIKAKTDNLPAAPAATGDVPTAAANAAALMDLSNGIETSITPRQALRLILAASAGKLSGAATTTVTIRNVGDSKNRITATVDSDGNRSAVTVDAT